MAYWTDENGLNHIDYLGHMCIHEMLARQGPDFYENSQDWLVEVMPSVDVVHIEISFFNLIFFIYFLFPSSVYLSANPRSVLITLTNTERRTKSMGCQVSSLKVKLANNKLPNNEIPE